LKNPCGKGLRKEKEFRKGLFNMVNSSDRLLNRGKMISILRKKRL
jgi:hypothetical protein